MFKIEELNSKMNIGLIPDMTLELDILTAFVYTLTVDSPSVELKSMHEDVLEDVPGIDRGKTAMTSSYDLKMEKYTLLMFNNIKCPYFPI